MDGLWRMFFFDLDISVRATLPAITKSGADKIFAILLHA
jgi:hypothetical protein